LGIGREAQLSSTVKEVLVHLNGCIIICVSRGTAGQGRHL